MQEVSQIKGIVEITLKPDQQIQELETVVDGVAGIEFGGHICTHVNGVDFCKQYPTLQAQVFVTAESSLPVGHAVAHYTIGRV